MDLDDLLAAAAPPVATRDEGLRADLDDLVDRTQHVAVPRRRRRLRVASVAVVGVLAAGTGAAAAGAFSPRSFPWHTESGSTCTVEFDVFIHDRNNGEQPLSPEVAAMSRAQKMEVVRTAQAFLRNFDYATIDHERAIRLWQAAEDRAIASEPPGDRQSRDVGDELAMDAVRYVVDNRLTAYLLRRGLNPDALIYGQGNRCDQ